MLGNAPDCPGRGSDDGEIFEVGATVGIGPIGMYTEVVPDGERDIEIQTEVLPNGDKDGIIPGGNGTYTEVVPDGDNRRGTETEVEPDGDMEKDIPCAAELLGMVVPIDVGVLLAKDEIFEVPDVVETPLLASVELVCEIEEAGVEEVVSLVLIWPDASAVLDTTDELGGTEDGAENADEVGVLEGTCDVPDD